MFVVFKAFDKDNDSFINMTEWTEGLSIFLRGSDEEKIRCISSLALFLELFKLSLSTHLFNILELFGMIDAFTVYDLNGDGYISREEMFQMLKTSIIKVYTQFKHIK